MIALIGAAVSLFTGLKQAGAMNRQADLQQKANADQRKQQRNAELRDRKRLNREKLLKTSQARQQAQAAGASETSSIKGGLSSLSSQSGSNLGYSTMQSGLGDRISMNQGLAMKAGAEANMWGAVGGIGSAIGSFSGFGQNNNQATVPNVSRGIG